MTALNSQQLQQTLALPEKTITRITSIGRPGREVNLPDDAAAEVLLEQLGVEAADRRDVLAARPDPDRNPELWWILSIMVDELIITMDQPIPPDGFQGWPALPRDLGARGRHLFVWALLVTTPVVRQVHADRRIDDDVSWATLSILGDVMREHRQITGESGVGLVGQWSAPLRFRGADFALGRHDFTRATLSVGGGAAEGGYVLMVHVPASGRLDVQASEESFDRARTFFPQHFPEEPVVAFSCVSWLLDPQLAEYLPYDSNILRFQRRFHLLPHLPLTDPWEADRELLESTFARQPPEHGLPDEVLDSLPQDTTFQRAFVAHLRAGRHWHKRTGYTEFCAI